MQKNTLMNESSAEKLRSEFPSGDIPLDQQQFGTWMIFPSVFKDIAKDERMKFYQAVQGFKMQVGSGFSCKAPEKYLNRGQLDRWLLKEPRALFRKDVDVRDGYAREEEELAEESQRTPRMRWVKWEKNEWKFPGQSKVQELRLAMLNANSKIMSPLPKGIQIDAFSLISNDGVLLVIIKVLPSAKGISLRRAMDLNYYLAHPQEDTPRIPVLVPGNLFDQKINNALQASGSGECVLSHAQAAKCLKLWPGIKKKEKQDDEIKWGKGRNSSTIVLKSFPELIKQTILDELGSEFGKEVECYQASRGRTNLFTRFLLPKEATELHCEDSIDQLQGLCSCCMQHPSTSEIVPLGTDDLQGNEFKTMRVTGSQRVHLSCETVLSFGEDRTPFSREWQNKWGDDYLLCFLIAYHQSILCQELSWSSFKKSSERNLEELNERYVNYCTHYDFSVISNQLNHQKIYRLTREVLGVPAITKEVGEEISARLDAQRNELQKKFNKGQQAFNEGQVEFVEQQKKFLTSQENFNSLAVVFFLLGCTTFLLNLNLKPFSSDAEIAWDFSEGMESLWFWIPVGLTSMLLVVPKIRNHLLRVLKLLFAKD